MTERLYDIKDHVINGTPYYGMDDTLPREEFELLTATTEETSLLAHQALYEKFYENDPSVMTFKDPDNKNEQQHKYLTFKDTYGNPLYGAWDPRHPATDIGIRGINPEFDGVVNPTTVIHADSLATRDFVERGAPGLLVEAIHAVARLNRFVEDNVIRPYLHHVAESVGIDPREYQRHFFADERTRRQRILTRVIMYHLNVIPEHRPLGSDSAELMIKEHNDKSSWTVDVKQTSPGLQYMIDGQWHDASTKVAAFRGTADSYLPIEAPATLHRAVVREDEPNRRLIQAGIARIAIPTFVSAIGDTVRVVQPQSEETHPLQ